MKKRIQPRKRPNRMLWIAGAAILVAATYFVFGKTETKEPTSSTSFALPPGDVSGTAPPFTLTDVSGASVSLADFKGKVVILDFWATWCPPCKREIPDFIRLQSEYGAKGVQIVGIALDEPDKVREFAKSNGMNYPVLFGTEDVSMRYGGVESIPTTFVIDKSGKIVTKFVGYRTKDVFEQQIKNLLSQ